MDRTLLAFLAVARTGNLTAAADQIGLTQPALTKTVRRVEREFGARLFERTTRGMVLTRAGELLRDRAERIEMHYRQGKEEIALLKAGVLEQFRIAAGTAYQAAIAPDLVKRLSFEFPETAFVLDFQVATSAMVRLTAGDLEMLLGSLDSIADEGIDTLPLLNVDMVIYACRDSALGRKPSVRPADLAGKKWVVYQHDPVMENRIYAYAADNMLPKPRIIMEIDSLLAGFRAVRGTEYVTTASSVVSAVAAEEGLKKLDLDHGVWHFASGAAYRRSLRDYRILRRAVDILHELTELYGPRHSTRL